MTVNGLTRRPTSALTMLPAESHAKPSSDLVCGEDSILIKTHADKTNEAAVALIETSAGRPEPVRSILIPRNTTRNAASGSPGINQNTMSGMLLILYHLNKLILSVSTV